MPRQFAGLRVGSHILHMRSSTRRTRLLCNGARGAGTGSGRSPPRPPRPPLPPPGRPDDIREQPRARDFGANGYEADREGRALNLSARRTTPLGGLPTEASVRAATTTIRRLGGKRASNTRAHAREGLCTVAIIIIIIIAIIYYYYYHFAAAQYNDIICKRYYELITSFFTTTVLFYPIYYNCIISIVIKFCCSLFVKRQE